MMQEVPNYLHPFTKLSSEDSREEIEEHIRNLKEAGLRSMTLEWADTRNQKGMMQFSAFDTEVYWERIGWVVEACRKYGMTFFIQDAAPFPTGEAEGWFRKPEYVALNKQYLAEKHMDIAGPLEEGCFQISALWEARSGESLYQMRLPEVLYPEDALLAIVAIRHEEEYYDLETAVDLTDKVEEGRLCWKVPEGAWRLFVIGETYQGGGRDYYMNLLDAESVQVLTKALHTPHYEHLKEEIGKTWLGFFYDETEVGNTPNYNFSTMPGSKVSLSGDSAHLPWSREMPALCREVMGEGYRTLLPLLWYPDKEAFHSVRYQYMDIVSRLIRENYNGQVYQWCKERGILYMGHNLEDENSHCRLGCGPVHYFRMQAHQDIAGVDVVGGQIMPKKDFTQSWYAAPEGDGEFYHYVLAKLASSEGHISVKKQGRSMCELLALYGTIAGTKLRRFVMDHLLVNGINHMVPAEPYAAGFPMEYTRAIHDYANRMCHLLNQTKPVIKTAVLYHADAEWFQGRYQYVQKPARELARHQISYDIVPSDVFAEEAEPLYAADWTEGLTINGNVYEALIIPEAEAITASVAAFFRQASQTRFPVFFVNRIPDRIAETGESWEAEYGTCVPLEELAKRVAEVIQPDMWVQEDRPWLRYNHIKAAEGEFYFLHNEGEGALCTITLPTEACVFQIDVRDWIVNEVLVRRAEGTVTFSYFFDEYEAALFYVGKPSDRVASQRLPAKTEKKRSPLEGCWSVTLPGGKTIRLNQLKNLSGKEIDLGFGGQAVYELTVNFQEVPDALSLGRVEEACKVFCNGTEAGLAVTAPYLFPIADLAVPGENKLRIEVESRPAYQKPEGLGSLLDGLTSNTYNAYRPCGLLGPVEAIFYQKQETEAK